MEAEGGRWSVIDVLIEEKFIAQVGKAQHAHQRRREDVSFLGDEILRAIFFAYREAGHVGSGRG